MRTRPGLAAWALPGLLLTLSACGGGAWSDIVDDQAQLQGQAATGAPIAGATVTATNRHGQRASTRTTADGRYALAIADGAPYLLQVTDGSGRSWYSYAGASNTANLTPLTTLALLQANDHQPLAALAAIWGSRTLTDDGVLKAARVVNANLAPQLLAQGVSPSDTNIFTVRFKADGLGMDAVLDSLRVQVDCTATRCTERITDGSDQLLLDWNADIDTGGFTLSWSGDDGGGSIGVGVGGCQAPRTGTYSLVVSTRIWTPDGAENVPDVCFDGLPSKPATQVEFCGSDTVRQRLPVGAAVFACRYDGSTGFIAARVGHPLLLSYETTWRFVLR